MAIRAFSLAGLATALSLLAAPANAGFFDDLARAFSGPPQPRQAIEPSNPLYVTVKPQWKRGARQRTRIPTAEAKSTPPKAPAVKLDPSSDPNWYLKDPTMRRGDIVITDRGVLVFYGRDADDMRRSDFAALGGKTNDKTWKGRLEAAAAGGRRFFGEGPAENRKAVISIAPPKEEESSGPIRTVQQ